MLKSLALAGVCSLGVTGFAQASTITGNFSGTVGAPSGATSPSFEYTGADTENLAWGTPGNTQQTVVAGNSSSLKVNALSFSFDHDDISGGSVLLGSLTWNNQSNWNAGGDWYSNVNLNVAFQTPSIVSLDQTVQFAVSNTTDVYYDTDQNELEGNNPDLIDGLVLDADAFNVPALLGNGYRLNSVFFALMDAGKGSTFSKDTGLWSNVEGGTSTIGIYGDISAVPLPAGVWLMFGGLGSFAALRRRKKVAV